MKKKCILFIITQHNFFLAYFIFQESSNVIVCHEFCMNAFDHVFGKILGKMQLTVKLEGGVLGKMGSSKTIVRLFVTIDAMPTVYCLCARKPTLNSGRWQTLHLNFLISSAHASDRRFAGYVTLTFPRPRLALVLQRRYRNQHEWGRMVAQRVYQVWMLRWQCGNTRHPHQIRWIHSQIWYGQV